MFRINAQPVGYLDPWNSPLEARIRQLAKGSQKVAYFYEYPDNRTFRYRVYNMIQALQNSTYGTSASFFCYDEIHAWDQAIDLADVLVFCRSRYNFAFNRAVLKAHKQGKRVLFDIDDLVFNTAYAHLVLDSVDEEINPSEPWDFWFAYMGRLGASLNLCDAAITTNEYLATQIHQFSGKPVAVIPNFLNREQMEISEHIFQEKKNRRYERDNRIHLGYFSGTPSHHKDFKVISDALVNLLERDPRITLRIVGNVDLKGSLQNYLSRIEAFPLQDFINLQRLIGEVEINLVPLQDNEFTNCKSELKYFEAGIVGTLTIATPVFTYAKAIKDGENGFLARSFEWYEKIYEGICLKESYSTMAERAHQDIVQKYAWYHQAEQLEKILFP